MAEIDLKVQKREEKGKQASKRLRRQGLIPGILYGIDMESASLAIDLKELLLLLHSVGRNTVVNLIVGRKRKKIKTFIYDIQHDPISGEIIHIDLKQISMEKKIHVSIPIHLTGIPEGVKNEGGIVEHMMHTIAIMSLPAEIPKGITIDISDLHLGDVIHVSDLTHDSFDVLSDEKSVVVHIIAPKVVMVPEVEIEEELEEEEEPVEPEVIGEEE